jgi:ABC-2 type transport system permease protein
MFERLKAMLIKEFIQIIRDPKMRFIIFVVPAFQLVVFGYAANTDVKHSATAIYDLDNSLESRDVISRFLKSGYFREAAYLHSEQGVREAIDSGRALAVLRINRGFSNEIRAGRTAEIQLILDGSDSNTAGIVLGYAERIVGSYGKQVLLTKLERMGIRQGLTEGVELNSRAWFNDNLESRLFYVPAIIALLLLIITMILSSMAVVREKEIGTMEQIIVTPILRSEFILGKTIPFVIIGFIDVVVVTGLAIYWFEVPFRGNPFVLLGATALYLMSTLGFGLFISTVSRTQQQAMMSAFFFVFPAMLLSGFAFPIENMPQPVQWVTYLNPLRYYIVIVRDVFLKGIGLQVLWPQFVAIAILGASILWFAIRRFHKSMS